MPFRRAGVAAPVARLVDKRRRDVSESLKSEGGRRVFHGDAAERGEHPAVPVVVLAVVGAHEILERPAFRRNRLRVFVVVSHSRERIVADGAVDFVHRAGESGLGELAHGRVAPHVRTWRTGGAHVHGERHGAHQHEREHAQDDQNGRAFLAGSNLFRFAHCLHPLPASR